MSSLRALLTGTALLATFAIQPLPVHATVSAGLPVPTERVDTPVNDPLMSPEVEETYVKLKYPMPAAAGPHPEACDWIGYLRFRHKNGPKESAKADAVLTTQPGTAMGASAYAIQGNQVVQKGAQRGKNLEYWAIDRRANCAEDHTGLEAAKKAKNPQIATDYYLKDKEVDGKRFAGFTYGSAMPYMAHIGMAQVFDDWRAVIVQAMPTVTERRKVLCGGHSYGAFLIGGMLGWDFDGNKETQDDAGYNICGAGGFSLEGFPITDPVRLRALPVLEQFVQVLGGYGGQTAVNAGLLSGIIPRTLDGAPVVGIPKLLATIGIAGLAADYAPKQETDLLRVASSQPDLMAAMRALYAPDYPSALSGIPGTGTYRLTGEAALGTMVDSNSNWLNIMQAGVGTFDGGPVIERTWPIPNLISKIPIVGDISTRGVGFGHLLAPLDPTKVYGWRNYDHVGDKDAQIPRDLLGQPITTPDKEVTDLHELAIAEHGAGPVDGWEWYFPTRTITDEVFAFGLGRTGDLAKLMYREEAYKKGRVLTLLAGDGPIQLNALLNLLTLEVANEFVTIPHYRHLDIVTAAARQNNGQPEPVSTKLVEFALKNAGQAAR